MKKRVSQNHTPVGRKRRTVVPLLHKAAAVLLCLGLLQFSPVSSAQLAPGAAGNTPIPQGQGGGEIEVGYTDAFPPVSDYTRFVRRNGARSNVEPAVSFISDQAVVLEYPSLWDVHDPPDPNYPNPRIQPAAFDTPRILDDLAAVVSSEVYDFVLLYTLQEVPAWINAGPRYICPAKNIGLNNHNCAPQNAWPPDGWPNLRSAPHMNDVAFTTFVTGPPSNLTNYGSSLTAFHEIGHLWGAYITHNNAVGPREWRPNMPVAWLAGVGAHWAWVWHDPGMPGILYSGATSARFNEFDLYAMGLMGYAEASTATYQLYEYHIPPPVPPVLHPVTLDDLIYSLSLGGPEYFEGNGRRIPDIDPSVANLRTLIVVVKGEDEILTPYDKGLVLELAAIIPPDWQIATWGRSTMNVDVESNLLPARLRMTPSAAAPGSVLRVAGSRFTANRTIPIRVNGFAVGAVTSDGNGEVRFKLSTNSSADGRYIISAEDAGDAALATLTLNSDAGLVVLAGQGPTFNISSQLRLEQTVFVPQLGVSRQ